MVGGDFNVIRFVHEKNRGGSTKSKRDFNDFDRFGNLRDSSLYNNNTKQPYPKYLGLAGIVLCLMQNILELMGKNS